MTDDRKERLLEGLSESQKEEVLHILEESGEMAAEEAANRFRRLD